MKIKTLKVYILTIFFLVLGCKKNENNCQDVFFGSPIKETGLSTSECKPICNCKNFVANTFTEQDIENLKSWKLSQPIELLPSNPYGSPLPSQEGGVCAVIIENSIEKTYRLQNFENEQQANEASAIVTHYGPCKQCSSLEDLAVYIETPTLGEVVRRCALENLLTPFNDLITCIEDIGFSSPCAQIWAFNAKNTQKKCLDICLEEIVREILFNETPKFNNTDGSLGACIECDEIKSGPIFKAYAGRTRRNSGLPSAICRTCDEVKIVQHNYPF